MSTFHLVNYRPGYVKVIDLSDCQCVDVEPLRLVASYICADFDIKLFYHRYPADLYLKIEEQMFRIKPDYWECDDKPRLFTVSLYDCNGIQYIRFVIEMNKGYKIAGCFTIATDKQAGKFITPFTNRRAIKRKIQELQEIQQRASKERKLAVPYEPSLEPLSAIAKDKSKYYSSSDLQLFLLDYKNKKKF